MSERHKRIKTEVLEQMDLLNSKREQLSKYELDLLDDRLNAIKQYGSAAVITDKQAQIIKHAYLIMKMRSM